MGSGWGGQVTVDRFADGDHPNADWRNKAGRCVVCATSVVWVSGFRKNLAGWVDSSLFVRDLADCEACLDAYPLSIVGLEVVLRNLVPVVSMLRSWGWRWPAARVAIVTRVTDPHVALALREFGVVHVASSQREMPALVQMMCRHLASLPRPSSALRDQIRQRLPWPSQPKPTN